MRKRRRFELIVEIKKMFSILKETTFFLELTATCTLEHYFFLKVKYNMARL